MAGETALIFACGERAPPAVVLALAGEAGAIIACDGALTTCREHGLWPDAVVGDMDSVEQDQLDEHVARGGSVVERPQQNANDLSKAIDWVHEQGFTTCWVVGATGGDPQHEWANLLTCGASSLRITCISHTHVYRFFTPGVSFSIELEPGDEFSLFALPVAEEVVLEGAAFSLSGETLTMGSRGLHNTSVGPKVQLSFKHGRLMMIHPLHLPWKAAGTNEA